MTTEHAGIGDEVIATVKGPDPEVWGEEHASTPPTGPGTDLVYLAEGVKGPDPAVWGEEHAAKAVPAGEA
jgi:hypothetical protein